MKELLKVEHLTKIFTSGLIGGFEIRAVDDVSFSIREGEIVSLVGESGSGKTTVGKLILRLLMPTSGKLLFEGRDVIKMKKKELKQYYYRRVQAVFQDPFASFNPLHTIDKVFDFVFDSYFPELDKNERDEMIDKALLQVGLNPDQIRGKFPHQLSGGQLQRILIARALLLKPKLLIADEIVSMLDASTRIDVLNLVGDFRDKYGTSVLFVTHDLALGYYISDTTIIMYRGTIVEMGNTEKVFHNPLHPYTQMLLESVPDLNVKWEFKGIEPEKEEESVYSIHGCRYAPRCHRATEKCFRVRPELREVEKHHWVACHLYE
ncbi:ABC transporter ATP-binding protein [Thermococcus sp.]|uniref:ABC transporter ATP-binding protein n=1 Tax=Thermococcus sp. TaxID=35749 RepID=UPI00262B56EB|nr:ABC transporter ATP-binding protein [Thermococcus sp.]